MSGEPAAGSDLQGIKSTAIEQPDGSYFGTLCALDPLPTQITGTAARYPSRATRRAVARIRPSLLVLEYTELWPNLILSSAARRLPMVLINGRMSQRSFPRWRRMSATISALLGRFDA